MTEAVPTEAPIQDNNQFDPAVDEVPLEEVEFPAEPPEQITITVAGKCVGRNRQPVPSEDVWRLAAIGMKDTEIADWFGIDNKTLKYNFSIELLKGRELLKQSLRRRQLAVAMSGNPTMLIFLGKNLLGQSDSPINASEKTPLPWNDGDE
jgi:hypothetical protein